MVIVSASSSSSSSASCCCRLLSTASTARISSSSSSTVAFTSRLSSIYSAFGVNSGSRRLRYAVSCVSKARAMEEMVKEKKESPPTVAAAASVVPSSFSSSSSSEKPQLAHSPSFVDVATEEDLLSRIRKEVEDGRLPSSVAQVMEELYQNYRNAVFQSGDPRAGEIVLSNMAVALDRMFIDVKAPFEFPSYHKAIREPFDYYTFVLDYIRPLIDFSNSYVGNISLFDEIEETLQQGENVVLMSNHQTEADPAIIELLLRSTHPQLAENMICVAGDRVITDPVCKPFSMGRNLLCVYSKKHMYDVPQLAEEKKRANTKSLKEMAKLLRDGSKIIWIAPSGGRDRPDPVTKEWYPAPFDVSSVDNMRRVVERAGVHGHMYPLAILCHDIMPPPPQVEKEIGERRVISFHGAGLSVAPRLSFREVTAAIEDPEEAKKAYTEALYGSVSQQYSVLKSAVLGKQGLNASNPSIMLTQPWK